MAITRSNSCYYIYHIINAVTPVHIYMNTRRKQPEIQPSNHENSVRYIKHLCKCVFWKIYI